ncbi:hypothetical protein JOD21_000839 [Jeotgalibacillus terrae]|nr:hypothetical protein [Jeotgalibacillus terrae]
MAYKLNYDKKFGFELKEKILLRRCHFEIERGKI